ncbi:probable CPS1-Gly-X carboxypeptidase YSCS precursor [Sporisorium reilianum SRZ2]|uniref:Probable CPS1-Gly-X carboxypeptidase YSCS n=1 Tax=Sporisorium reilianum (strain SRZ2) TaxID=999809 RepID=E6ZUN2_SPORE|nr:probable CPS1-Gly-X carboxypeptidase YSCS precursor [Sporisorium reilianum SRZ2]
MGKIEETQAGLPTSHPPVESRQRPLLRRLLRICILALICFALKHTNTELLKLPSPPSSHRQPFSSQGNAACPQVPPFQLPTSNSTLGLISNNAEIELPSSDELAQLLSGAVQVDTSVGDDWPTVKQDPARWEAVFAPFHDYLRSAFPRIYAPDSPVKVETVNEWGLVYTFPGSDESLPPLVLMAHQDVVPVEPETIPAWTHPPFSGFIDNDNGLVWGRGAGDCKTSIVSILATLESLLKSGYTPARTVVCSFGFDEESAGTQGGMELANFLHERYGDDGVAMIVDEGGEIDLELGVPVASPAVAEKGYLDARIAVYTPGGHSSAPRDHTSIGMLAQLITAIEANPYKATLQLADKKANEINPALQFLQCTRDTPNADRKLSKALEKLERLQRKVEASEGSCKSGKKTLQSKLNKQAAKVLSLMDRNQRFGFQTTQAVDLISGGVKINNLPEQASAVVNHRIDVTSSVADVRHHIYRTLVPVARKLNLAITGDSPAWDFIPATPTKGAAGKIVLSDAFDSALEPAPFTPLQAAPWALLQGVMRAVWTDVLVAPDVMGGNTDTKSYWKLTRHIFRFSPGSDRPFPIKGGWENIHTVDERAMIHGLVKAVEFYSLLIRAVGSQSL